MACHNNFEIGLLMLSWKQKKCCVSLALRRKVNFIDMELC